MYDSIKNQDLIFFIEDSSYYYYNEITMFTTTMNNYLTEFFPEFAALPSDVVLGAESTERRGCYALKTFKEFILSHSNELPGVFTVQHIVCYMLHRIASTEGTGGAGAVKLNVFLSAELFSLCKAARKEFGVVRFPLDMKTIFADALFKNAITLAKKKFGGVRDEVHARPIWYRDEQRLLAATSWCTRGYHDRALLVTLIHTGARGKDACDILMKVHVKFKKDVDGQDMCVIRIPNCKDARNGEAQGVLKGEAFKIMNEWIIRRREIFPSNGYLFVNYKGNQLSSRDICKMMDNLSRLAGYGEKFFTSHSGRMAFGCRTAARVFSRGGSGDDVYETARSSGLWKTDSNVVRKYCDLNVRRFFEEESVTFDEFKELDPVLLHDLRELKPVERRSSTWFKHGLVRLRRFASSIGLRTLEDCHDETKIRTLINRKLISIDTAYRTFIRSHLGSGRDVGTKILCILFELRIIDVGFNFASLSESQKTLILQQIQYSDGSVCKERRILMTKSALRVNVFKFTTVNEAFKMREVLTHKKKDRRVNVGQLPDGTTFLLSFRRIESECEEVEQIPTLEQLGYVFEDGQSEVGSGDVPFVEPEDEPEHFGDPRPDWLDEDDGAALRYVPPSETPRRRTRSCIGVETPSTADTVSRRTRSRRD